MQRISINDILRRAIVRNDLDEIDHIISTNDPNINLSQLYGDTAEYGHREISLSISDRKRTNTYYIRVTLTYHFSY